MLLLDYLDADAANAGAGIARQHAPHRCQRAAHAKIDDKVLLTDRVAGSDEGM